MPPGAEIIRQSSDHDSSSKSEFLCPTHSYTIAMLPFQPPAAAPGRLIPARSPYALRLHGRSPLLGVDERTRVVASGTAHGEAGPNGTNDAVVAQLQAERDSLAAALVGIFEAARGAVGAPHFPAEAGTSKRSGNSGIRGRGEAAEAAGLPASCSYSESLQEKVDDEGEGGV